MWRRWSAISAAAILASACQSPPPAGPGAAEVRGGRYEVELIAVEPRASLRGLWTVGSQVAWAAGANGTWLRSADAGRTWRGGVAPGCERLDFRSIVGLDATTACMANAGSPAHILRTSDGGQSWTRTWFCDEPEIFLDAMSFWNARDGIVLGDPIDGHFVILLTHDGGQTWQRRRGPQARPAEAAFAASGTCLITSGRPRRSSAATASSRRAAFVTGGATARLLVSDDGGESWRDEPIDIPAGAASQGAFSIASRGASEMLIVGGDYSRPEKGAIARVGGRAVAPAALGGYRSCVAISTGGRVLAVGPTGGEFSDDGAVSWRPLIDAGGNAVRFFEGSDDAVVVGADGRVLRLEWKP
jgi:photosystem II stability/assembly factor-like uncharacterized protein